MGRVGTGLIRYQQGYPGVAGVPRLFNNQRCNCVSKLLSHDLPQASINASLALQIERFLG